MRKSLTIFLIAAFVLAAGVAEAGWEEGVAAFKAGNLDTAAQEFRGVVEKSPDFAGGHFMLGQVLLKQRKNREALEALRKAYELDSENISYQMALSQAYLGNNRFSDAAQLLRRINVGSLPRAQQTVYYQMLGVALQQSGDESGALSALKRVADASPNDSDAWYRYGTVAFNLGQTDAAVSALEKAVNLDGNDPDKRKAYAQALVRKARLTRGDNKREVYAKATGVADALARQQPTYDNLLFLGEVQLGAARYQDAVNTLRQAAGKTSSDWHPHYYLSQAYTQLNQWDAVASSAQTALDRAQDAETRQRVWGQIGFAFEKQKRFDESIDAYRKAGDQAGVERVTENKRIAEENEQIEEENAKIKQMEEERKRLEEELRDLGGPPRQ
jgi:tetratricopeptide (TPR) repeat protein